MSLHISYTDPLTKESKEIYIKVCLSADFKDENNVSEHPSETQKAFTDNSIEMLKELPVTVFIPAEEEYESIQLVNNSPIFNASNITLTPKNSLLNDSFTSNIIPVNNFSNLYTTVTKTLLKEDVYEGLSKLKKQGVPLNLIVNNKFFTGYLLKSLSFPENIDSGDGWDVSLTFKEAIITKSKKTQLSAEELVALKKLKAEMEKKNADTSGLKKKITTNNKTSPVSDKGKKELKNGVIEDYIKSRPSSTIGADVQYFDPKTNKYHVNMNNDNGKMMYDEIISKGANKKIIVQDKWTLAK